MEKKSLIGAAVNGSPEAFCSLYEDYKDRLYRYAFYRLSDSHDAEDAVSDCVLSAWRQIGGLKEPAAFDAWIFRILYGCVNARIREQAGRRKTDSLSERGNPAADRDAALQVPDPSSSVAERTDLERAMENLKEEERDIVLLSAIGGFHSGEIAAMTGLRPGAVRSKLSRSLAKLRKCLVGSTESEEK